MYTGKDTDPYPPHAKGVTKAQIFPDAAGTPSVENNCLARSTALCRENIGEAATANATLPAMPICIPHAQHTQTVVILVSKCTNYV